MLNLTVSRTLVAASLAVALSSGMAMADKSPPKGSKPTDPNTIIKLYAGKTSNWNSGGGAYWAPNGDLQATGRKGHAVGLGKWYVTTKSKLCQDATYYWEENGSTQTENWEGCWEFKTAPDGVVWERFLPEKGEWWPHRPEKQVKGNTLKNQLNSNRKRLGV